MYVSAGIVHSVVAAVVVVYRSGVGDVPAAAAVVTADGLRSIRGG